MKAVPAKETCFHERDPNIPLFRRVAVECAGTLLLMFAATSSALSAQHLAPDSPFVGLLASALAITGTLVGLIIALGSISGGHFNPLISILQWLTGERKFDCALAYVVAQCTGAICGALLANAIFDTNSKDLVELPSSLWSLAFSEIMASAGLMIVVFGCARSGRTDTGPFAVGAWLMAAIVAFPSSSYANPAIALAALFSSGPVHLSITTASAYAAAEAIGGLVASGFIVVVFASTPDLSEEIGSVEIGRTSS